MPRRAPTPRSAFVLRTAGALTLSALAGLAACGPSPESPSPEPAPEASEAVILTAGDLEVGQARVQLFGDMGAAFFTVHNAGDTADRLLRVEAGARSVEIHETVADGSVLRMESREDGFEILPGETLELKPGGKHVMLVEPAPAPAGSDTYPLRLVFERSGTLEVAAQLEGFGVPGGGSPRAAEPDDEEP